MRTCKKAFTFHFFIEKDHVKYKMLKSVTFTLSHKLSQNTTKVLDAHQFHFTWGLFV